MVISNKITTFVNLNEINPTDDTGQNPTDMEKKIDTAYFKFLNERFDKRVKVLLRNGFLYDKEHVCFTKNLDRGFELGNYLSNGTIMHCEDAYFDYVLRKS